MPAEDPTGAMLIVLDSWAPCGTVTVAGEAAIVKSPRLEKAAVDGDVGRVGVGACGGEDVGDLHGLAGRPIALEVDGVDAAVVLVAEDAVVGL